MAPRAPLPRACRPALTHSVRPPASFAGHSRPENAGRSSKGVCEFTRPAQVCGRPGQPLWGKCGLPPRFLTINSVYSVEILCFHPPGGGFRRDSGLAGPPPLPGRWCTPVVTVSGLDSRPACPGEPQLGGGPLVLYEVTGCCGPCPQAEPRSGLSVHRAPVVRFL